MDQDGLNIALTLVAAAILVSGLTRGAFDIQFFHADRGTRPVAYWTCAVVMALVALEAGRRAWFLGCVEC
jgi:hypothetical protein